MSEALNPAASLSTFSVATWNVNSIAAHERQVLDWLEAERPTVLALQETQCSPSRFPTTGFRKLGYEIVCVGDGGSNGVAIASLKPLSNVELGMPGAHAPFNEPRFLAATVDGIRIVCAYAPNGRKVGTDPHRFKLAWFALLTAIVNYEIETHPDLIVAADLNIAPTDLDVWDAHHYRNRNLTSPLERTAFEELLSAGLVDIVRAHSEPNQKLSTWWNRRGDFYETNRGWRLDHLLTTPSLASRITSVTIDRATRAAPNTSDHAPTLAHFTL
jgi:exodeoxyribonuclease III